MEKAVHLFFASFIKMIENKKQKDEVSKLVSEKLQANNDNKYKQIQLQWTPHI